MAENERALDLLSTSQTRTEIRCVYGAPMVALVMAGKATIGQACCNHWDCPKCGEKRAKQEYRRIVAGAEKLAQDHELYFWTLTCRGRELSLEDAEENYYAWTNRLLTNARAKANRAGEFWVYVQITERQKKTRLHPHSHIITTFLPSDAVATRDTKGRDAYVSAWFTQGNESAGLGSQHKITKIESAAATSRYVAKYMFKAAMQEKWPAKWKRVRYSQSWPDLPKFQPDIVHVLRGAKDWRYAEREKVLYVAETQFDYERAIHHIGNVLPPNYLTS